MSKKQNTTVKMVNEKIKSILNCSNTVIAGLIGTHKNTLVKNNDTPIAAWNTKDYGSKLTALLFVIERLYEFSPHFPKQGYLHAISALIQKDPVSGFRKSAGSLILEGRLDNFDYLWILTKQGADDFLDNERDRVRRSSLFESIKEEVSPSYYEEGYKKIASSEKTAEVVF